MEIQATQNQHPSEHPNSPTLAEIPSGLMRFVRKVINRLYLAIIPGSNFFVDDGPRGSVASPGTKPSEEKTGAGRLNKNNMEQHAAVASAAAPEVAPMSNEASNFYEPLLWNDLDSLPTGDPSTRGIVCLRYVPEEENSLADWVLRYSRREEELQFKIIVVFAKYSELGSFEVARLRSKFVKVGATFDDWPKGANSFAEAVAAYTSELAWRGKADDVLREEFSRAA